MYLQMNRDFICLNEIELVTGCDCHERLSLTSCQERSGQVNQNELTHVNRTS